MFSVFTREWLQTDVAICDGYVAGLGEYAGKEVIHAGGKYVVPGFVDAHMHLESSKLLVDEFARLVLPLGTTAVVADPHEIANVLGTDGVHWLADLCNDVPLDVFFMASSCVPASTFVFAWAQTYGQLTMKPASSLSNWEALVSSLAVENAGPTAPEVATSCMTSAARSPAGVSKPSLISSGSVEFSSMMWPPADSMSALNHTVSDSARGPWALRILSWS